MKLLIASDIHGSAFWCRKLMQLYDREQPDRLLLLGDILYHGPRNRLPREYDPPAVIAMLTPAAERILCVRGNCEAEVDQMVLPFPCMAPYCQFAADGLNLYMTHGHLASPEQLPKLPEGTVFLFGHTHVKVDQMHGGVRCLNPGSVSIPKDGSHSCLIYRDGAFAFQILEA